MQLKHLFTDEQNALRDMIRKFVDKEIMPIREKMEEDYSLVEEVHQKLVDLGIQKAGYPAPYGGTGPGPLTNLAILCEELARGDAGISLAVGLNGGIVLMAAMLAENKVVMDEFIPAFCRDFNGVIYFTLVHFLAVGLGFFDFHQNDRVH